MVAVALLLLLLLLLLALLLLLLVAKTPPFGLSLYDLFDCAQHSALRRLAEFETDMGLAAESVRRYLGEGEAMATCSWRCCTSSRRATCPWSHGSPATGARARAAGPLGPRTRAV
jgi:hypothetical protein